ncbi:unnamed protein product, partial [Ranitomeya imitator]
QTAGALPPPPFASGMQRSPFPPSPWRRRHLGRSLPRRLRRLFASSWSYSLTPGPPLYTAALPELSCNRTTLSRLYLLRYLLSWAGSYTKGPFTLSDAAAIPTTIRIAAASLFGRWRAVTQTALQRPTMPVTRVNIGQYRRSAEHSAGGQTAVVTTNASLLLPIIVLEIRTVVLHQVHCLLAGHPIRIQLDNATAVPYVSHLAETLRGYFSQYGEVVDCVIMKDKTTNQSRGFGFVKFKDPNCVGTVLASRPHTLDGRNIDPKPCTPRGMQPERTRPREGWQQKSPRTESNKSNKIFVGGIPHNCGEAELRDYFKRFGVPHRYPAFKSGGVRSRSRSDLTRSALDQGANWWEDRWVRELVSSGYKIELTSNPPDRFFLSVPPKPPAKAHAFRQAVSSLLQAGVIVPVPMAERFRGFYSNLFVVPKNGGSVRPILDLKQLNKYVRVRHFRMESLRSIIASMEKG